MSKKTVSTAAAAAAGSGLIPPSGTFKLYYFDVPGRGFASRIALFHAGFEFEDIRIKFQELTKLRSEKGYNADIPLGSLPVLVFPNGKDRVVQSNAIARYAAKFSDLYPSDPLEALIVDEAIDTCADISTSAPQDPDKEKKKALREEWAEKKAPKYFNHLSNRIEQSGGPFLLGKQLTVADLVIFSVVSAISNGDYDYVAKDYVSSRWPLLGAHGEAVKESSPVKNFLEKYGKL